MDKSTRLLAQGLDEPRSDVTQFNDLCNLGIGSQGLDEPISGDPWNLGIGSQGHVIRWGEIEEGFGV